ncbi:MAG: tripartite tricarboxylate transporter TctB family protein [Actinomycetota bacterium]|nr:tripartite tricarboxylate transporter TctB family protein [Actinomycetota bacterium]
MGDQAEEGTTRSDAGADRDVPVGTDQPDGERTGLPVTRLLFLLVLTVVAAAYTVMAFDLEWRLRNGQIGPGFFPRIVGTVIVVACLVVIVRVLLGGSGPSSSTPTADVDEEAELGVEGDGRTDAWVPTMTVGCMVLCYVVFETLGALLASVLFLALLLSVVNRGHHLQNALVSVLVPVGLYLLFEVLLDSGLPPGVVLPPL